MQLTTGNNRGKNSPGYSVDDILAGTKGRLSNRAYKALTGKDEWNVPWIQLPETQPKPE